MMGAHQDCPICMGPMTECDNLYPILCPSQCGFNMCQTCVRRLVDSSKDDYQEASDGNRHVKVQLQCPQCRGNLKETLQDTLLMRQAKHSEKYRGLSDSELTATELRMKHEFVKLYAKDVQHAELRLRKFQKDQLGVIESELPERLELTKSSMEEEEERKEEESTEATSPPLFQESANTPAAGNQSQKKEKPRIDTTLFSGLEFCMSDAEQEYVTELMTSGNPQLLAQGAHILNGVLQLMMAGQATVNAAGAKAPSRQSWAQERRELEKLEQFKKLHPLPRMPKYVVLAPFPASSNSGRIKKVLSFTDDDEWDGSIADAFSRQYRNEEDPAHAEKARVKVSAIRGAAGKLGVQKGDVVTHINNEPYEGNAADLKRRIYDLYDEDPEQTFSLVLNAEETTAEILQSRAEAAIAKSVKLSR